MTITNLLIGAGIFIFASIFLIYGINMLIEGFKERENDWKIAGLSFTALSLIVYGFGCLVLGW